MVVMVVVMTVMGMGWKRKWTVPPTNALPDPSVEICDTIGQW
jgi:hypothetical protein